MLETDQLKNFRYKHLSTEAHLNLIRFTTIAATVFILFFDDSIHFMLALLPIIGYLNLRILIRSKISKNAQNKIMSDTSCPCVIKNLLTKKENTTWLELDRYTQTKIKNSKTTSQTKLAHKIKRFLNIIFFINILILASLIYFGTIFHNHNLIISEINLMSDSAQNCLKQAVNDNKKNLMAYSLISMIKFKNHVRSCQGLLDN